MRRSRVLVIEILVVLLCAGLGVGSTQPTAHISHPTQEPNSNGLFPTPLAAGKPTVSVEPQVSHSIPRISSDPTSSARAAGAPAQSTPGPIAGMPTQAPVALNGLEPSDDILRFSDRMEVAAVVAVTPSPAQEGDSAEEAAAPTEPLTDSAVLALTPEQLAQAQAAIQQAQTRMSQARTQYRLTSIAAATAEVNAAEQELAKLGVTDMAAQSAANASNQEAQAALAQQIADAQKEQQAAETELQQAKTGGVTDADLAAAQAQIDGAEADLQKVNVAPDQERIGAAQAALQQSQDQAKQIADAASAAKTAAEQQMNEAADGLRVAQEAYSTAFWNNQQAESGVDPATGKQLGKDGQDKAAQKQQYADALAQAQLILNQSQAKLDQAKAHLDDARQQEVTQVAAAQTQVDAAQAQLTQAQQGPNPDALAAAQAKVDQAKAHLADLQRGGDPAVIAKVQERVDQAKANLEKLASQPATGTVSGDGKDTAAIDAAERRLADAKAQLVRVRQASINGSPWTWPTYGTITSGYGLRAMAVGQFHNGVDIANNKDTPIAAARDGQVIEAGWCAGYGYCVRLQHAGGFLTEYGHLDGQPPVQVGQTVQVGTIIGMMGTTYDSAHGGYSTGVHLHFTIRLNGVAVDPLLYLP